MAGYKTHDIAVEGGTLHFAEWGVTGPVIMCSHGLTANHTCWEALVDQIGSDVRLIAPDHRGRGKSNGITGPFGMDAHARDMIAIMDYLNIEKAELIIGHSMGGFVAAVAAVQAPDRFDKVLLIDGGLPSLDKMPVDLPIEQLVHAIIGPSMERLDMQFESKATYHEFWKAHPCFANDWSDYVETYIDYDLVGAEPALKSGVQKAAILRDVETQLLTDLLPDSLDALTLPTRFLKAERGMANADPLYADDAIEAWAARVQDFEWKLVKDVNHFTIGLSERGGKLLADEIRDML